MRFIAVLLLTLSLQACSVMDVLSAFTPSAPGVAIEAQVGDRAVVLGDKREQEVEIDGDNAHVSTDNTKTKQQFAGNVKSVTINDSNPWLILALMLIAIVGWLCPRPSTMWRNWRDKRSK